MCEGVAGEKGFEKRVVLWVGKFGKGCWVSSRPLVTLKAGWLRFWRRSSKSPYTTHFPVSLLPPSESLKTFQLIHRASMVLQLEMASLRMFCSSFME